MASISLLQRAKELETRIRGILSSFDIDGLSHSQRNLVATIMRQAADVKLDIRDYEYAETRDEQLAQVHQGKRRFAALQKNIIRASEYDMFSAMDIAQISAHIEHITSNME